MSTPAGQAAVAAALFATTNVDDLVVLALLSASSRASGRPRRWQLWGGQLAGFAVLAGVSLAAGRGLALIPERWLGLIAVVPLGLGAAGLAAAFRAARRGEQLSPPSPGGLSGVAALTIVNGADNLAAYTPFFATRGPGQSAVALTVFAAGVAAWCLAGWLLAGHARVITIVGRHGHWILPVALILVGLYTLRQTGVSG
jgi:cadmium resistance protein CadD (predicted permease)